MPIVGLGIEVCKLEAFRGELFGQVALGEQRGAMDLHRGPSDAEGAVGRANEGVDVLTDGSAMDGAEEIKWKPWRWPRPISTKCSGSMKQQVVGGDDYDFEVLRPFRPWRLPRPVSTWSMREQHREEKAKSLHHLVRVTFRWFDVEQHQVVQARLHLQSPSALAALSVGCFGGRSSIFGP